MSESMDYESVIAVFLPHRLSRFVRQVDRETRTYMESPSMRGHPGYLRRDAVRWRLVKRAYQRYAATV